MIDEGYIKFNCNWQEAGALSEDQTKDLIYWRNFLWGKGLIGIYSDGIGFGNISKRMEGDQFIISGTNTGGIAEIKNEHFTLVHHIEIDKNYLECKGPVKASSESMSHGVVYQASTDIGAVVHIHHLAFWRALLDQVPTTSDKVPYGTPEMAYEIQRLFKETNLSEVKILAMAGHEEGVITFGKDLEEAVDVVEKWMGKKLDGQND